MASEEAKTIHRLLEYNPRGGGFQRDEKSPLEVREEEKLRVTFDGKSIDYDFDELDQIGLAYATSIHKSQGSEYPAVVIPLHTSHYPMLHRSILYTAVTRGKELVVLVGSKKALWMAIRNIRVEQRFTGLKERLIGA